VTAVFGTVVWVLAGVAMAFVIWRVGVAALRSLTTPLPEPPPAGELRKVNLRYRCSICGTELKLTLANDELPDPPRHCQEDMDLVAPVLE
jgi:hypothetical protein